MLNQNNIVVLAALVFAFVMSGKGSRDLTSPPSQDAAAIPAPSVELQAAVAPIQTIAKQNPQVAARLSDFYVAASDVVRRDEKMIDTTGQVRQWIIEAEWLYMQKTDMTGKLPGFSSAANKVIADTVGLDVVALDQAKRTTLADTLSAIAWALRN